MIGTIIESLMVLAGCCSLMAWQLVKIDPLTQIARGAIYSRTALRVASNVGREAFFTWRYETARQYQMARISEGC